MNRPPRGFTVIELAMVVTMIGLLVLISFPRLAALNARTDLRSAGQRLASTVTVARGAAIRRGRHAFFNQDGSTIWVTVDTGGVNPDTVLGKVSLDSTYGVSIVQPTAPTVIDFDPRGIGNNSNIVMSRFYLSKNGYTDSVCVSRLGDVRKGCTI
jgi:prepilin-type N-terminal cleavage/methylation domain-containing protein